MSNLCAFLLILISNQSQVGICLKHLPAYAAETDHFFHSENVPWQRVISAKGIISPRCDFLSFSEVFFSFDYGKLR